MRLLAFAASLRQGSFNRQLLQHAVADARALGAEVDVAEFREFDMPLYNQDVEDQGYPPGSDEFKRRIEAVDGLLIASPEYNFSLPGTLKNAIDWASRYRPVPLEGKSALLISASPSLVGGIRGLWQLRIPLEGLGVFVYPDMYALGSAHGAFDDQGRLKDAQMAQRLRGTIEGYLWMAGALIKH